MRKCRKKNKPKQNSSRDNPFGISAAVLPYPDCYYKSIVCVYGVQI
jgi:hypothetical protein